MKREAMYIEKIFANHVSNRRLVSRIYNELSKSMNKKQSNFKRGRGLEYFTK